MKVTNVRSTLGNEVVDLLEAKIVEILVNQLSGIYTNIDHCEIQVDYISFKVTKWHLAVYS